MAIAIITGASSGIGKSLARHIKATGNVDGYLLIARRREKLEDLAKELGEGAVILPADLGTQEGIETVRTWLSENKPAVRYLINAAGFGVFGDYTQVSEEETVGMIDLNVKAKKDQPKNRRWQIRLTLSGKVNLPTLSPCSTAGII